MEPRGPNICSATKSGRAFAYDLRGTTPEFRAREAVNGVPAIGPLDIRRAANAIRLGPLAVQRIGDDLVLESQPRARRRHAAPFASQQGAR